MKTPIDRGDQPLSAYLNKILTIIIRRSGGELRLPANEMIDDVGGEGFSKFYDRETKELVLRYLPANSEVYYNKSEDQWPSSQNSNSHSSPARSGLATQLRQSDLMDNSTLNPSIPRSGSTLDDSMIADLEDHHRKEAAARLVANFPETPITAPRSQPRRDSSRNPSSPLQERFFRG